MTDTPNTPESKPVPMADLRSAAARLFGGGWPDTAAIVYAALDELERLREIDAPALAAAVEAAKETVADLEAQLAREREGAGVLRRSAEAEEAMSRGFSLESDLREARIAADEIRSAALSSDAGKAALEEKRALEARVTELGTLADLYAKNANELSAQHRVERDALKAEVEQERWKLVAAETQIERLKVERLAVVAELRNFVLNGANAPAQIRGIYSDLEEATNHIRALKAEVAVVRAVAEERRWFSELRKVAPTTAEVEGVLEDYDRARSTSPAGGAQ